MVKVPSTILKSLGLKVRVDRRDMRTPDKMWDAIKKGIPLRVEIGGREMDNGEVTSVRRDIGRESKQTIAVGGRYDEKALF